MRTTASTATTPRTRSTAPVPTRAGATIPSCPNWWTCTTTTTTPAAVRTERSRPGTTGRRTSTSPRSPRPLPPSTRTRTSSSMTIRRIRSCRRTRASRRGSCIRAASSGASPSWRRPATGSPAESLSSTRRIPRRSAIRPIMSSAPTARPACPPTSISATWALATTPTSGPRASASGSSWTSTIPSTSPPVPGAISATRRFS